MPLLTLLSILRLSRKTSASIGHSRVLYKESSIRVRHFQLELLERYVWSSQIEWSKLKRAFYSKWRVEILFLLEQWDLSSANQEIMMKEKLNPLGYFICFLLAIIWQYINSTSKKYAFSYDIFHQTDNLPKCTYVIIFLNHTCTKLMQNPDTEFWVEL